MVGGQSLGVFELEAGQRGRKELRRECEEGERVGGFDAWEGH